MDYKVAEKIVKNAESKVFKEWRNLAGITQEQFLEALLWLCEDPKNGGSDGKHMTRQIALANGYIKKLARVHEKLGFVRFVDENSRPWEGEFFRVPASTVKNGEFYADDEGMLEIRAKISLSKGDRI